MCYQAVLSIRIDETEAGRLVVGLFGRAAPEAVTYFLSLVEGRGSEQGHDISIPH